MSTFQLHNASELLQKKIEIFQMSLRLTQIECEYFRCQRAISTLRIKRNEHRQELIQQAIQLFEQQKINYSSARHEECVTICDHLNDVSLYRAELQTLENKEARYIADLEQLRKEIDAAEQRMPKYKIIDVVEIKKSSLDELD